MTVSGRQAAGRWARASRRCAYQEREAALEATADDRTAWETGTRQQRQAAVAADAELRRRHPDQAWEPLRSAEPDPVTTADEASQDQGTPTAIKAMQPSLDEMAARHREFTGKLAELAARIAIVASTDVEDRRPAYPLLAPRRTGAILQPPAPEMPPSPHILSRAAEQERDWEAAD